VTARDGVFDLVVNIVMPIDLPLNTCICSLSRLRPLDAKGNSNCEGFRSPSLLLLPGGLGTAAFEFLLYTSKVDPYDVLLLKIGMGHQL